MDYTPGAMDNYVIGTYPVRGWNPKSDTWINPGSLGTRARQMAMLALYEAPLQMLCDSPTKYEKNTECFSFMSKIPTVWKRTVGLCGVPSTHAVVARQAKDGSWYVAGISNREAREITLPTSFLGTGTWCAEIFRDTVDGAKLPRNFVHERRVITPGHDIKIYLAPGGGFVMRLDLETKSGHCTVK